MMKAKQFKTKIYSHADSLILIFAVGSGSPTQVAGSNAPLRGGKGSDWEGGTRVPAFVTGGVLPTQKAGKTLDGIVSIRE